MKSIKTISILKAANITKDCDIPSLLIVIDKQLETRNLSLKDLRIVFDDEGKKLADALGNSLPGGLLDALLRELLNRRASLLIIPT